METVINRHGLDLEALKASRLPLTGGSETVDSTSVQYAGNLLLIKLHLASHGKSCSDVSLSLCCI